ncbi:MAG: glutamate-1-semialdehyde 2,1-aminomutase, partial [Planctomycetes bacterium]|nr:glutamate-1-semialdehyde 2,1-aminomutase [Planctomycetota bacterium]
KAAFPSIEKVRLVSSGTEATMSAIRLARGYTKRDSIVKFSGCYHGHADGLLVAAGSGLATFGTPTSPGVPQAYAQHTFVVPFNDIDDVNEVCEAKGKEIACLIVEPIMGNMGVIPPKPGFLAGLREITKKHGIVLIFDEVITGFRVAYGGAQQLYGITPDLTTLGKIIGGGLPVGAYGGRAEIMDHIKPLGEVYQAGTLSGNPLAVSAGIATLEKLAETGVYEKLEAMTDRLTNGIKAAAADTGVPSVHTRVGSMFTTFFTDEPVFDNDSAMKCDTETYGQYFWAMLDRGIYFAPSQFEAVFVSLAHTDADIAKTIAACREVMESL